MSILAARITSNQDTAEFVAVEYSRLWMWVERMCAFAHASYVVFRECSDAGSMSSARWGSDFRALSARGLDRRWDVVLPVP